MSAPLQTELLARLSEWATREFGLRFPPDRWNELGRGIASAALDLGIPDLAGWTETLLCGQALPEHLHAIANHVTISETYFFRHPDSFRLLETEILPERLTCRREQKQPLRVWSAGCATGEEPYSVAMLLRQRFPDIPSAQLRIVGTDINSQVLERARRGIYTEWSFRETPEWLKTAYFQRLPNGRLQLRDEIRELVRFTLLNLAAPVFAPEFGERASFDVVLCRNTLMYFSADAQRLVLQRLVQALAPDGWLLTGPCDVAADEAAALQLVNARPGVFRKTGTEQRQAAPPPVWAGPNPAPVQIEEPSFGGRATENPPPAEPVPTADTRPAPPARPPANPGTEPAAARAKAHADRGDLNEALAACEEAIAADKTNPELHYLHGCILQEQNRIAEAAEAFRRVVFLEPRAVMAHFALGCLALRAGQAEAGRRHFGLVLRLLQARQRGESIAGTEGLTVGRLRALIEGTLNDAA